MHKGIIPNPEIQLLEIDPVFGMPNKVPLMIVKQGIQAVLLKDYKKLEKLLRDNENVYTVHWQRSPHIKYGPIQYALLNEDKEALKILGDFVKRGEVRAAKPKITLDKKDTGR